MISAIVKELSFRKHELQNTTIETIYFGGGTPSMLTVSEIETIMNAVYENYEVSVTPEITLEANPDDLSKEKLTALSTSAINRLSIGIQSFFDTHLTFMNRAHSSKEAKECLENATKLFTNITVDLIYGIPNMNEREWRTNLETVFSYNIQHLSSYALTVEPKTALERFIQKGVCPDVSEEASFKHFEILTEEAAKNGFIQYEISNFGKPSFFSKHNTSYWKGKIYVGIGPGAHTFHKKERSWNVSSNNLYIKSIESGERPFTAETLSENDRYNEYVMTGLRTIWGISLVYIEDEFGKNNLQHTKKTAENYLHEQLLFQEENALKVTEKGKFLCDGIASDFFKINN